MTGAEKKIRAWDRCGKQMAEWKLHHIKDTNILQYMFVGKDGFYYPWEHPDLEILEATGIKDKNDKEIYVGDIYTQGDIRIKYEAMFKDGAYCGKQIGNKSTAGLFWFRSKIEKIGNIYENPELIEKETK